MNSPNQHTYGVEVRPFRDRPGFVARYWAPGISPGDIRNPGTGEIVVFETESDAKAAGADRLFDVLNAPRLRVVSRSGKQEKYQKLSGPEFAALLRESGLTLTLFTYLYGTNERRVLQWIDGRDKDGKEELAPHPVRVMLELFKARPENIDYAEKITNEVTTPYRYSTSGAVPST